MLVNRREKKKKGKRKKKKGTGPMAGCDDLVGLQPSSFLFMAAGNQRVPVPPESTSTRAAFRMQNETLVSWSTISLSPPSSIPFLHEDEREEMEVESVAMGGLWKAIAFILSM
jgi:hypothetical protein